MSITISLLTGYAAFIPADALGASGVLAAVTAGIYMGVRGPRIIPARTRLQGYFVWDILDFLVNADAVRAHRPPAPHGGRTRSAGYSAATLAGYALAVSGGGGRHAARVVRSPSRT